MRRDTESKAVRKYLAVWAEKEARDLELPDREYDHVVVIPARGEGEELFRAIDSVPSSEGGVLVIVVLNAGEADAPERHAANAAVRDRFAIAGRHRFAIAGRHRFAITELYDRALPGRFLPPKQGVGLARKIGCDVALRLWAAGRIRSRFIHTTDADVSLPPDLFERVGPFQAVKGPVALLFPFTHTPDPDPLLARAIVLYEIALRYHRLGLESAGSPYAFHTVGSTIAVDARAYAEVRGFPKKEAGEDFYLIDKLAKLGPVTSLGGAPIRIRGRASDRVPFGTGRTLLEFQRGDRSIDEYRLLDPRVFLHLRGVLDWLRDEYARFRTESSGLRGSAEESWNAAGLNGAAMGEVLENMRAFDALQTFLKPSHDSIRNRACMTWFDAFRTLRFLHDLRDRAFPSRPFFEALVEAPFIGLPVFAAGDGPAALGHVLNLDLMNCAGRTPGFTTGQGPLLHL